VTRLPGLTAITLGEEGGGVAAVARLVRRVMQDEWGRECPVYELSPTAMGAPSIARTAARVGFGARVAVAELAGRSSWLFHSHLGVARVQQYIPRALGRPYAVFLHGIEVWSPLAASDRRLLDEAALVITNSEHTSRRAREANPWLPPVAVCPLAYGSAADVPATTNSPAAPVVLTVARMASTERYKGHDQLIDALPALHRDVPGARLIFVGTGDDVVRLQKKARELGVDGHVTFTGFLSDTSLREAYREAAVFAMPSRGEGFGLTYLEAMSAGLPCVGSRQDAASEIIEDGRTGYLVDQDDVAGLADRLRRLLSDPSLRAELGAHGQERWAREFTYEQFRRRLLRVLATAFPMADVETIQPSVTR
jgi:phosphatidylinositol alpha-1,6-mannosyltransferase